MVKVNILQLLTVYVLQFIINDKTLHICCLVLIIGSVEVGPDIDMKFHQEVMEIVIYDISIMFEFYSPFSTTPIMFCKLATVLAFVVTPSY